MVMVVIVRNMVKVRILACNRPSLGCGLGQAGPDFRRKPAVLLCRLEVERRTCDQEVAGSSLAHCTAVYGSGQAVLYVSLPL